MMDDQYKKYHRYLNDSDADTSNYQEEDVAVKEFLEKSKSLKPVGFSKSKSVIWDAIEDKITSDNSESKIHNFKNKRIWYVAAAISFLCATGLILFNQLKTDEILVHQVRSEENKEVFLPDGSSAYINAVSEIAYNKDWDRTLDLKGEAFFQVTKGDKFTVNTSLGSVQVLGTSFNVSARNEVFLVACKTGKVKVSFANGSHEEVILTKGESVLFENNLVKKIKVAEDKIGEWKTGVFHYRNRPFSEAVTEIKRQYNVIVEVKGIDISDRLYTGYFVTGDIESSLTMICEPLGLKYSLNNKRVIIEAEK